MQLVSHSMGGLVTLAAVNKRHDLFHSCLFGGSPFQPCAPMFLGYIANGRPAGLNKKLLTGRVHFTWSSAYGVFPITGKGIVDSEGTELTFDFFDVDTWVREQWGLFHPDHAQTLVGQPEFDEYRCAAVGFSGLCVARVWEELLILLFSCAGLAGRWSFSKGKQASCTEYALWLTLTRNLRVGLFTIYLSAVQGLNQLERVNPGQSVSRMRCTYIHKYMQLCLHT